MDIIDVRPKDVHVLIELSVAQIGHILDYLDHCVFEFNSEESELKAAKEYVENEFFKPLDKLSEELKNGSRPNSPGI